MTEKIRELKKTANLPFELTVKEAADTLCDFVKGNPKCESALLRLILAINGGIMERPVYDSEGNLIAIRYKKMQNW